MVDILTFFGLFLIVNCILIVIVWDLYGSKIQGLITRKTGKDIIFGNLLNSFLFIFILFCLFRTTTPRSSFT